MFLTVCQYLFYLVMLNETITRFKLLCSLSDRSGSSIIITLFPSLCMSVDNIVLHGLCFVFVVLTICRNLPYQIMLNEFINRHIFSYLLSDRIGSSIIITSFFFLIYC